MYHPLQSSNPIGLYAETREGSSLAHHKLYLHGHKVDAYISFADLVGLMKYVLTNTDLDENDPRLMLVNMIKDSNITEGENGKKRISISDDKWVMPTPKRRFFR